MIWGATKLISWWGQVAHLSPQGLCSPLKLGALGGLQGAAFGQMVQAQPSLAAAWCFWG